MTAALVEDLAGVENGLEKPCAGQLNQPRPHPATWHAWARHGGRHREASAYACDECKQEAEELWIAALTYELKCECGAHYTGQLSDHFRAIRL